MQNDWKIFITDYAWPSIEPERQVLAEIGAELIAAETGDAAELLTLAPMMDGILTCWKPVLDPVIAAAEKCQIIARCGIGLDNIDVEAATEHGIVVTNVPAYCIDEVSDHAMGLLLACARKISRFSRATRRAVYGSRTSDQRCTDYEAKPSVSSGLDGLRDPLCQKRKVLD